jgi:hypothetical protein
MPGVESMLGLTYGDLPSLELLKNIEIPGPERIEHQSYISMPERGISLFLPDNETVATVQLYSAGSDGFDEYAGKLPEGLRFAMSRSQVRETLGQPDEHGEESEIIFLGKSPPWDVFYRDGLKIHVEYTFGVDAIRLLSVSRP